MRPVCIWGGRYTLTYSEGTWNPHLSLLPASIYPHIHWGNLVVFVSYLSSSDIPSHTVRERWTSALVYISHRYTLTYSEGTVEKLKKDGKKTIYPHIQWGNRIYLFHRLFLTDIPSHTVREQSGSWLIDQFSRYTLTYSEGTLSVYAGFSRLKHLVVQIAQMSF